MAALPTAVYATSSIGNSAQRWDCPEFDKLYTKLSIWRTQSKTLNNLMG
jgi:hypothetical protein